MITGMLFNMYVSVGENECLLDTQWEYPQEDPLSDTGFEEVEDQVIAAVFISMACIDYRTLKSTLWVMMKSRE